MASSFEKAPGQALFLQALVPLTDVKHTVTQYSGMMAIIPYSKIISSPGCQKQQSSVQGGIWQVGNETNLWKWTLHKWAVRVHIDLACCEVNASQSHSIYIAREARELASFRLNL